MIQKKVFLLKEFKVVNFKQEDDLKQVFLIPNIGSIAREMTEKSQIMLIVSRFLSLNLINKLKLIFNNLVFIPNLLKMDFAVGIKVLCELEILKALESQGKTHFVLHNQMVDMALALKNIKILEYFFYLSKKYGFIPGIVSYNIGPLIKLLSVSITVPKNLNIYTPVNNNGHLMNPYYKGIEESLNGISLNFINITNE